jgi:ABC-type dipeptide/oligopeptide/nickel transport system permease subunit
VLGGGIVNLVLVLAISGWPVFVRVVRAQVMHIKEQEYVQAARVVGATDWRIVFRQVVPNLWDSIIVLTSTQVARMIISEAFLSFLGLGIMPPTPTWGNMLGEARNYMFDKWWLPTFPGIAIFITTLAINLLGDALRDYLDPHSSSY